MEGFAILFSIPGAFFACLIYRAVVLQINSHWGGLKAAFVPVSYLVLAVILVEWIFLVTLGPVGTRLLVGSAYYPVHELGFLLGVPALVNILVLPNPRNLRARWYWVAPLGAMFALVLVLQQYGVSEALFGINGDSGPFSGSIE